MLHTLQLGQMGLRRASVSGGGGGATDPHFANVVALLHMNGVDGSTTFTDVTGKTWTANGNAQIDTAFAKFGSASMLLDGNGDYLSTASHADFGFGTGDFTVEGWFRRTAQNTNGFLADFRVSAGNSFVVWCSQGSNTNRLGYSNELGTGFVASATQWTDQQFIHWAVSRDSGTVRGFMSGALVFTTTDSRTFASPQGVYLGSGTGANLGAIGSLDEVRITKGVARYTAAFTPPTAAFPDS